MYGKKKKTYYDDYLEHHGVLGMKWGVRRYQNYDGSYTQAGMKRYNKSKENYEAATAQYKTVKTLVKETKKHGSVTTSDGKLIAVTPGVAKEAKAVQKQAKKQLVKDYKHLKQDKLGDQGKKLYAEGKTITGNHRVESVLSTIGGLSLAYLGNQYAKQGRIDINNRTNQIVAAVGATSLAAAGIVGVKNAYQDKRLRAYYGHTSNY